ncbi:MAG TPA: ACT domain-containing protein [Anaerolineales bacterium]
MSVHKLLLLDELLAVCQFQASAPFPDWAQGEHLLAVVRTPQEVTIVCAERFAPPGIRAEPGWQALQVEGPLEFDQVGVLASLAGPLAQAGVSVFAISTFSTDYLLVKQSQLDQALAALEKVGHSISEN